jgi:zinc and cadmium transporter
MVLAWIVGASLLSLAISVGGAAVVILSSVSLRSRIVPLLVPYATGTLLGAAFLGMLPTALVGASSTGILRTVLIGVVLFFVLEKIVLWRHCHEAECPALHGRAAPLILVGDAVHNFVDGIVIAGAFLAGTAVGVTTAVAVIAHEIPQELGDFAILLESGFSKQRALFWNIASGLPVLFGGVAAWALLERLQNALPYTLALAAASFLYIATADLIPHLHQREGWRASARQLTLMLAGIGTIALLRLGH